MFLVQQKRSPLPPRISSAEIPTQAKPRSLDPKPGFYLLLGLVALFAVGKVILADTLDPDSFWHIRVGQQIAANGWPGLLVDHLSFASMPQPWVPYSWLAELGMKSLWDAGGYRAAIAVQALMEGAFIFLLGMTAMESTRRASGRPRYISSIAATAFGAVLSLAYLSFRPVTAVLMILAAIAWILQRDARMDQRSRAVWFIPPLTALAVNMHFFAVLAPLWLFALLVGDLLDNFINRAPHYQATHGDSGPRQGNEERRKEAGRRSESLASSLLSTFSFLRARARTPHPNPSAAHLLRGKERRRRRVSRGIALFVSTTLACMLTPMLSGTIRTMVHYSLHDVMVHSPKIAEMQPFYRGTMGIILSSLVLAIILLAVIRYSKDKSGAGAIFWLLGSALLLLTAGRMSPVFAIIAVPTLASAGPKFSDRILSKKPVIAMLVLVLIGVITRLALSFPAPSQPISTWLNRNGPDAPHYPCAAADFVEQNIHPSSHRLICEFSWGGYLEWRFAGQYKTLMDGRTQVFSSEFWKSVYFSSELHRELLLQSTGADAAILSVNSPFLPTLSKLGWKIAYEDEFARVLVPAH